MEITKIKLGTIEVRLEWILLLYWKDQIKTIEIKSEYIKEWYKVSVFLQ